MNASIGYGNYNALFVTLKIAGLARGDHAVELHLVQGAGNGRRSAGHQRGARRQIPSTCRTGYGYQAFDRRFIYNLFLVYQPHWYKSQSGFLGHVLGGWTIAPVFTAGSGLPITLGTVNGGGQAFGEGDSVNFFGYGVSENAIPINPVYGQRFGPLQRSRFERNWRRRLRGQHVRRIRRGV